MGGRTIAIFVAQLAVTALIFMPAAVAGLRHAARDRLRSPAAPRRRRGCRRTAHGRRNRERLRELAHVAGPAESRRRGGHRCDAAVVVFTILLALAITRPPAASRERLVGFFEALCDAMLQLLVRWVVALAPVGVFALILPLAARGRGGTRRRCRSVHSDLTRIGCSRRRPRCCIRPPRSAAVSPSASSPRAAPTRPAHRVQHQLLASRRSRDSSRVRTATSRWTAACPASCCRRRVGLQARRTGHLDRRSLFVAHFYGIPSTCPSSAIIGLASVFMVFISPGIPRGGFLVLAPLFLAIGLPVEGHWHPHRRRRDPRHLRDPAQRHRRPPRHSPRSPGDAARHQHEAARAAAQTSGHSRALGAWPGPSHRNVG